MKLPEQTAVFSYHLLQIAAARTYAHRVAVGTAAEVDILRLQKRLAALLAEEETAAEVAAFTAFHPRIFTAPQHCDQDQKAGDVEKERVSVRQMDHFSPLCHNTVIRSSPFCRRFTVADNRKRSGNRSLCNARDRRKH